MNIIDFISECQYMLDSANYRSKIHLLTNCNVTQLRTVTSETNYFFPSLGGANPATKHNNDPSAKLSHVADVPRPPRLVQKQNN